MQESLQDLRDKYIKALANSSSPDLRRSELADDLFALDLTVYSDNFSFDSIIYNAFAQSNIDPNICMHPEQLRIISHIENNSASIISAPTSFGKTFCIFEYIVKHKPKNIVLIVPTLALVDEYFKRIIKKYETFFSNYKVYRTIDENKKYDFSGNNIFILTHDKAIQEHEILESIDFLVIDEVYKLETDKTDDRVLILNMAYYYLARKAHKYVLLAPFIDNVSDMELLEKKPKFFKSNYSPVVNDIVPKEILNEEDRFSECAKILSTFTDNDKTLIYFPTVEMMYDYVNEIIENASMLINLPPEVKYFIEWAKEEIHEEWCLVKALEKGYLIHNGQLPSAIKLFHLSFYENNPVYNKMLCTSTLLEGVNTTAKNIIIVKASRKLNTPGEHFSAFDFYNLVGRTGRLKKHYVGTAYYIKSPNDPIFSKNEAIKTIKFEITDNSKDIDIQTRQAQKHTDYVNFLNVLNITEEEYEKYIGSKPRFDNVKEIYDRYNKYKNSLDLILLEYKNNTEKARYELVKIIYRITLNKGDPVEIFLISGLLNRNRLSIKRVVDDTRNHFTNSDYNIDTIISKAIKLKSSLIEHTLYNRACLIRFFLEKDKCEPELIKILEDKILTPIEILYYSNSKHKKTLVEMGVYEKDVDKIIKIVGEDFEDAFELKNRLAKNLEKINRTKKITYITKFVITNLFKD